MKLTASDTGRYRRIFTHPAESGSPFFCKFGIGKSTDKPKMHHTSNRHKA
jgi:hypothetical protein